MHCLIDMKEKIYLILFYILLFIVTMVLLSFIGK